MNFQPGQLYHMYNRSTKREQSFYSKEHYLLFTEKIEKILPKFCDLLAYCLMPNHYYLVINPKPYLPGHKFKMIFKETIDYYPLARALI